MKKYSMIATAIAILLISAGGLWAASDTAAEDRTPLQGRDRVESVLYGQPLTGGLLMRLSKVERDLFGMELPGSLTERQQALQMFVFDGSAPQPSLLFKIGVAEWVTLRRTNPSRTLSDRVANIDTTLEGDMQEGALSARLERIITKLLPGGISAAEVQIPAATVFKAKFMNTVTVRNVAVGDVLYLELDEDCVINGTLTVAKGDRLFATVTKVLMPRSFGRSSEIHFDFKNIETIGGRPVPVIVGPEAQKAMEVDTGMVGAAGASLAGAIVFGPLGIAGGFLVRGNDRQIPEGTYVYVETEEFSNVEGYTIPDLMNMMRGSDAPASAETQGMQDSAPSDTVVY
jgi:hypothetical protein